jgi:hypothetical protein
MRHLYVNTTWRRMANIAVIIAGIWVLLISVWSPEAAGPREQQIEVARQDVWFYALWAAGTLAIASVFVALRSALLARVLLGAGAITLLAGLFGFRAWGTLAWGTLIIPGIIMLLAIPFMGPLPTPEQEGQIRKSPGEPGERDIWDPERRS